MNKIRKRYQHRPSGAGDVIKIWDADMLTIVGECYRVDIAEKVCDALNDMGEQEAELREKLHAANLRIFVADKMADCLEESISEGCRMCKRLNQQHEECESCDEKDSTARVLKIYRESGVK